ncbi:MAG: peptide-methionine (S)-S-oxide reductase MsrA [Patescibacteria group bacterium]|nr:peptide-methionine (S)-S-oxide reductase MsrA [Patescibacteria group bacterium]
MEPLASKSRPESPLEVKETVVLGGGCFWCTEAVFKMLKGVISVEPGYAGGEARTATYEQVSRGDTGHVEVAKIEYDPNRLAFEELLGVFFAAHDPTTLNRQGNDVGPQYASVIFYTTESQQKKAENYIAALNKRYGNRIVTKITPFKEFFPAENYHRNYYEAHKDAPYCELVIAPKLEKVEEKFSGLVREDT